VRSFCVLRLRLLLLLLLDELVVRCLLLVISQGI
jgi:hypothetical protein